MIDNEEVWTLFWVISSKVESRVECKEENEEWNEWWNDSSLAWHFFSKDRSNEVSLKEGNTILFDKRSAFLLEELVWKEKVKGDEASNEEGIKSMRFEKDWDPFLEAFLLKIASRIISLFR